MSDLRWIVTPEEIAADPDLEVGGKARHLARATAAGLPVPAWLAIPAAASLPAGEGATADLAAGLETAVDTALTTLLDPAAGHRYLAVRSSAVGEDAADDSFAGLHDSFLFVGDREEAVRAVRAVWASVRGERALAYRRARGLPTGDLAIGVVLQRMVEPRTSGVLFTADPTTSDVRRMVLSALWGSGEGLVSEGLDADTWTIRKADLATTATLAEKHERMVFDVAAGHGTRRDAVPEAERSVPCLDAQQIAAAARLGLGVERLFGQPQDLELAWDRDGALFLLQARPITTVDELGPAAGHHVLWDNSNIIESYSGVTSPMTFSFIRRAYGIVYHCFAEVMGVDRTTVRRSRVVFETMLGLFRGQVYYNLRNWYRLVQLFPGFRFNRRFMESMMGVSRELADEELDAAAPATTARGSGLRRWLVELPALLRLVAVTGWRFLRIRRTVGDFQRYFAERYERWRRLDFRAMAPHELLALYRRMEDELLWEWKAPIVNDFFVMVSYGTLKKLCADWAGDADGSLQNQLLAGQGGIESTEPTRLLLRLAGEVRRDPALVARVAAASPAELAREVATEEHWRGLREGLARFLDLYGFRGMHELKLEEPSLHERPELLFQVLRNYVTAADWGTLDPDAALERERRSCRAAEARVATALAARRGLLPRRWIFRRVLENARLGVRNRENLRFARTRIYGVLRQMLVALGERFAAEGILAAADDVFYLTLDEVWDYVQGTAVSTDLAGLATLRRGEYDGHRQAAPPADRFETWGLPYHRNRYRPVEPASTGDLSGDGPAEDPGVLRGTPCSPGIVTAAVKVVRSPADDVRLAGEILVAGRTDPGWVPLYPSCSGLLVGRGSILSHSAIVAREMGLPTVVGIPGLLTRLASGQQVTMDGAAGTVRLAAPATATGSGAP